MKILLAGGGTGGHFYPVIAVAEEINRIAKEKRLLKPELYFMSTESYDDALLYEHNITFKAISAGKLRRNMSFTNSILNIIDLFKTGWGVLSAIWTMFLIYPDVVFGKGGYSSFPALLAARILRIPVVIHESDTSPGKVNGWAGKFAARIATSYPESAQFFPKGKTAYTGNPIRKELMDPLVTGAEEFLHLEKNVPVIFILGGSQGAQRINEVVIDALPQLVDKYEIIHQVGRKNIAAIQETKEVILMNNPHKDRYKPFDFLNLLSMRMAAGAASLVISRAGSTIFEIASWGKASIIIPIPERIAHDQRTNAFAYARSGACEVIEEENLTPHVFVAEINRLIENTAEREKLEAAAKNFSRRDAARLIAEEVLSIALSHEK